MPGLGSTPCSGGCTAAHQAALMRCSELAGRPPGGRGAAGGGQHWPQLLGGSQEKREHKSGSAGAISQGYVWHRPATSFTLRRC